MVLSADIMNSSDYVTQLDTEIYSKIKKDSIAKDKRNHDQHPEGPQYPALQESVSHYSEETPKICGLPKIHKWKPVVSCIARRKHHVCGETHTWPLF